MQLLIKLLQNISTEQKSIFIFGDFNVNLLNYNGHMIFRLFSFLGSFSFISLVLQATRITSYSNTLIDIIFSNFIDPGIISGNLITTISNHLSQFAIIPNMFGNIFNNKSNIYRRGWSRFDLENFVVDYFSVDWEDMLKVHEVNVDISTKI